MNLSVTKDFVQLFCNFNHTTEMKFFYEVTPTNENKTKTKTSGNFYVGILLEE